MFVRNLYSIKDVKSGFSDPCSQPNDAVAGRSFERQIPHLSDDLGIPCSDFQLWRIGQIDLDSGMLIPCTPELLVDGATFFRKDVTSLEESECSSSDSE